MTSSRILTGLGLSALLLLSVSCRQSSENRTDTTAANESYVHPPQTVQNVIPTEEQVAWATQFQSISGPGKEIVGKGRGGWVSGTSGVSYSGPYPRPEYNLDDSICDGSAVAAGLVPPIVPAMELHLRDGVVTLGGDGNYYLCGSPGDNIWAYNKGLELWKSADLHHWSYLGVVFDFDRDGEDWVKGWRQHPRRVVRAVWAPEIHYVKGNYFICFSMCPGGTCIVKSATGKPEGPYVNAFSDKGPITTGIDATLFQDDDGSVYFTWNGGNRIARLKDDMSGLAEPFREIEIEADTDPSHHDASCNNRKAYNHSGREGATIFKHNGLYYLGAADTYEGRYSMCVSVSENIYGPYRMRHEAVPCGGGTGIFKDKRGNWWCSYFGNDTQSPFREKISFVKIGFNSSGRIYPAKDQPFVPKEERRAWHESWKKHWKPVAKR